MSIPVVWFKGQRGSWDHGIFLQTFEKHSWLFPQYNEKINPSFDRAIVMCVGKPNVRELKHYLQTIKSGVVIFASEEDAYYPWKEVMHPGLEAWCQYWHPSTKADIKRENRILLGAPYRIKDVTIEKHTEKKYLWSFVGQVQNPFRQKAVEAMKRLPDGYLKVISGFGGYSEDGMDYDTYLDIMCHSRFVICPAGSMCVDSFRVYEAIECGAIPITDVRSPRDPDGFNYWNEVYPANTLDLIACDWSEGVLADAMGYELKLGNENVVIGHEGDVYHGLHNHYWWWRYKRELEQKLIMLAQ